jgi:hypothetical protein
MTPTTPYDAATTSTPTTDTAREAARRARIDAIRFGATVRQALGQSATHRRLADGRHAVTIDGRTFTGATLDQAIRRAREQRP